MAPSAPSQSASWVHIMIGGYFRFHSGKTKRIDVQRLIKDVEFSEGNSLSPENDGNTYDETG